MKTKLTSLLTALVAFAAVGAFAQPDSKPASKEEGREKFKNLTPAEREAKAKEWREKNGGDKGGRPDRGDNGERMQKAVKELGLDPEELKKLPPEERRAKLMEAAKKKTEELKKKQADGTITEEEKKLLERMEQRRKFMEENRGKGGRPNHEGAEKGEKKDKDARVPEVQAPEKK